MPLKVIIRNGRALVQVPVPTNILGVSKQLEGRNHWPKTGGFSFEPTPFNLGKLLEAFPDAEVEDTRSPDGKYWPGMASPADSVQDGAIPQSRTTYQSLTQPYGQYQADCHKATIEGLRRDGYFAILMEQGTGKSKVAVDVAGELFCSGELTGVVIVAFNGVHIQWLEEAFPDHLGDMVKWRGWAYGKKKQLPIWMTNPAPDKMDVLSINFEAVFRADGRKALDEFVLAHRNNVLFIVDEGQRIKNPDAKSTQEICDMAKYCKYRVDLTGTPLVKDLTDIWSQFKFLDPRGTSGIGHKYKSTFRSEYARMHPKLNGVVIGTRNEEQFYERIAPHVFRITKAEAIPDLPPKIYDKVLFELHPDQRKVYDALRDEFASELDGGKKVTIKHALSLLIRLQQVSCGFVANDDGEITELPNARLDVLKRVLKARNGKKIIWCRFTRDVEVIQEMLGERAVTYYGEDSKAQKVDAKRAFILDEDIEAFISNPAAAGTGVDGLQRVSSCAIYYSQSFNVVHRWQSEDRIHRIGAGDASATYIDLVARGTIDRSILSNHKKKKDLADLVLDDIRMMLKEGDEE